MFFTSLTTAMAFAVSASSPFLAVYSFGAFSCVLVVVNYLSVVIFFPTVVVTYHLYWERYKVRSDLEAKHDQTDPPAFLSKLFSKHEQFLILDPACLPAQCCCCCPRRDVPRATHPSSVPLQKAGSGRRHPVVRFFHGPYFRFITHPVWRWVILVAYAALLAVFIYFASKLQVNQEQVRSGVAPLGAGSLRVRDHPNRRGPAREQL